MKKKYFVKIGVVGVVVGTVKKTITCEPSEFDAKLLEVTRAISSRTKRVLEHVTKGEKNKQVIISVKDKFESS